tara:strand:+ start:1149 stop:1427 length:279 start_codon:yes stop_codon:yes gene_type:complete
VLFLIEKLSYKRIKENEQADKNLSRFRQDRENQWNKVRLETARRQKILDKQFAEQQKTLARQLAIYDNSRTPITTDVHDETIRYSSDEYQSK